MSFQCPTCRSNTHVVDSRDHTEGTDPTIKRRRACTRGHRFNTLEIVLPSHPATAKTIVASVRESTENARKGLDSVDAMMDDFLKLIS